MIKTLNERLSVKEFKLFMYLAVESNSRNIGDICKALHTTPLTLLSKTKPNMERKFEEFERDYKKWLEENGEHNYFPTGKDVNRIIRNVKFN